MARVGYSIVGGGFRSISIAETENQLMCPEDLDGATSLRDGRQDKYSTNRWGLIFVGRRSHPERHKYVSPTLISDASIATAPLCLLITLEASDTILDATQKLLGLAGR